MNNQSQNSKHSLSRRNFLALTSSATVGLGSLPLISVGETATTSGSPTEPIPAIVPEWRNKQSGMAYRMLGRTGMMVSEVVCGGDPVGQGHIRPVEMALERGLNYLDMAPAYGRGECERNYGKIIDSPSKRAKVFMTTKVSGFSAVRDQLYKEIFDGLPSEKQQAIRQRAAEMRAQRGVDKPGYYFTYWPGQDKSMDPAYLSNAMMKDYAHKVEGSKAFREKIVSSVEGSLQRTGTDYFDILMCPHGANCPEEVQIPEIWETFEQLKKDGKVRFLGVSTHNDPAGVLNAARESGQFDVCMCAYNIANGGYLEGAIKAAHEAG
ncbi:MAG: aldo/keto reductase, partial [Bacteroidetes bacterium]